METAMTFKIHPHADKKAPVVTLNTNPSEFKRPVANL